MRGLPTTAILLAVAAVAFAQIALSSFAPTVIATFGSNGAILAFESIFPVSEIHRNTTDHTLQFQFAEPNATSNFEAVDALSAADKLAQYGIVAWIVVGTSTATAPIATTTTTTMAPVPTTTTSAPTTSAPVDPASSNLLFELFLLPGWEVRAAIDDITATVARMVAVPKWRLAFSPMYAVSKPNATGTAANGYAVEYDPYHLLQFRVTPSCGGAPPVGDTSGNFTSVLVVNGRVLSRAAAIVLGTPYAVELVPVPNAVPYTPENAAADGHREYMKERLNFMGALVGSGLLLSALLVGGFVYSQRLAEADLKAQLEKRHQQAMRALVYGAGAAHTAGASSTEQFSPSSRMPSVGGAPQSPGSPSSDLLGYNMLAPTPRAGPHSPPGRTRRSVSFHHSTTMPPGAGPLAGNPPPAPRNTPASEL